ncbi:cytochrome P450 [Nonomuraea angiospora]|uniref:cytochrome P450 n=1 Tax=Nonomuraea angiospora TaxID=46172 RepID=UPI0029AD21CC|nr:cytochrome P450 [Nonomuraea angiospora]MDX3101898.1 cytochrome P450 [Nonomuraea angiospora]
MSANAEAEQIVATLLTTPPQDPYPLYARLREIAPIHQASVAPFWTLCRYEDIQKLVKERRFVRDVDDTRRRSGQATDLERPFTRSQQHWFVFTNPPQYQPKRVLYNTAFNRTYVESLRPLMTKFVDELLDDAQDRGELEAINDLAFELTVRVICHVLGVPRENADLLIDWAEMIEGAFEPLATESFKTEADRRTVRVEAFLTGLVENERRNPGDNLLGRLIAADKDGLISQEELIANVPLVFSAGLDTTTHFIGNALHSFMRNRDQWQLFVTDPEALVTNAVEELIRYDSSVQSSPPLRLASEDIEIGGVTIAKGDGVIPFFGAAHRDPDRYDNPDTLDITRKDINTLAFGGGIHICLGQHLARVESQVALVQIAKRFPNLQLTGPDPTWRLHGANNRTLDALYLELQP